MRPLLEPVHEKVRKSNAGRKPFDVVLMFKILVLQTLYNLADEQVEYRIRDRLSFARFLGLGIEDAVPDATTVWCFRERLQEQELLETVFDRFDDFLAAEGFEARQGSLMLPSLRCRFDEMPGHATRRQVIAGVLVPRRVRAGTDAGRTRAAEGNGRRPIVCNRNWTDPISGCVKNGDAPVPASRVWLLQLLEVQAVLVGNGAGEGRGK